MSVFMYGMLMLPLCGHKANAKAVRLVLLKLSQNLCFRPEYMQYKFFQQFKKLTPVLIKKLKFFPAQVLVFHFENRAVLFSKLTLDADITT